jgi:hypothetical protein
MKAVTILLVLLFGLVALPARADMCSDMDRGLILFDAVLDDPTDDKKSQELVEFLNTPDKATRRDGTIWDTYRSLLSNLLYGASFLTLGKEKEADRFFIKSARQIEDIREHCPQFSVIRVRVLVRGLETSRCNKTKIASSPDHYVN